MPIFMLNRRFQTGCHHASVTTYVNYQQLFGAKQQANFYKEMFDIAARKLNISN